jgi:malonyl-CoA/methylmalonyl-CoA synthetase
MLLPATMQVPKRWHWLPAMPRNAMGKVNKRELLKLVPQKTPH